MNDRQFNICVVLAVILTGMLAYSNSFSNDFVWDDASSVLLHRHVQDPSQFFQLFREDLHAFGRGQGNFYRPLLAASFMLDYALSRPAPGSQPSPLLFHLTNTLWHIAAALLLAALLRRFRVPKPVLFIVPVLYVVHPLHTQAVTYISGRGDPMAATFMFAALWFSLWEGGAGRRFAGTVLGLLCFVAAVLSKESAVIYPFLLLILLLTAPSSNTVEPHVEETSSRFWGRLIPLAVGFVAVAVYGVLRATVLRFADESTSPNVGLVSRVTDALKALTVYVRLIIAPTDLHMERTLDGVPTLAILGGILVLLILAAGIVFGIRFGNRRIAGGAAWFLVTWFPISGIIPLNAQIAEHWMYVPLAGLIWAAVETVWMILAKRGVLVQRVAGVTTFVVVLLCLYATASRNLVWRDNETLFRDTLAKNPNSIRVHFNLAVTYEDILKNIPGARRHYEKVLSLYKEKKAAEGINEDTFWPDELEAHISLGRIYAEQGNLDRAANHFQTVLRVQPNEQNRPYLAEASLGLGKCLLSIGDTDNAKKLFEQAAKLNPQLAVQQGAMSESAGQPDTSPPKENPSTQDVGKTTQ